MKELTEYLTNLVKSGEHKSIAEAIKERCIWCDDYSIEKVEDTYYSEAGEKSDECEHVFKFKDKFYRIIWTANHISWEETEIDLYNLNTSSICEVELKKITIEKWVPVGDSK